MHAHIYANHIAVRQLVGISRIIRLSCMGVKTRLCHFKFSFLYLVPSSHSFSLSLYLSLSQTHTHTHTHTDAQTLAHYFFLYLNLSLTHTHRQIISFSISISLFHTHTHTLSLSFSLSCSPHIKQSFTKNIQIVQILIRKMFVLCMLTLFIHALKLFKPYSPNRILSYK